MNIKCAIDSMHSWLEEHFTKVTPKKMRGGRYTTVKDIEKGSPEEIAHLKYMIAEMREMPINNEEDVEKLMRWIGFVQGALWSVGYFSIDNFREMNTHE